MAGPGLPVNVDSTYSDDTGDASVKLHQQHHDSIHTIANRHDLTAPSTTGSVDVWDGSLFTARLLRQSDANPQIEQVSLAGPTKSVDISVSTAKVYTLTGNVTFTFTGAPTGGNGGRAAVFSMVVIQDATGGRTTTWPGSVTWVGNSGAPSLNTTANAKTLFEFLTTDGGTTWLGHQPGLNSGGGAAASDTQSGIVIVKPQIGNNSTKEAWCREHGLLTSNTNNTTVIQAAIDHASNFVGGTAHRGGEVRIASFEYDLTSPIIGRAVTVGASPTVWPVQIRGEGGLKNAAAGTGVHAGTKLNWTGGSAPTGGGAVLNLSDDCHGYNVYNIGIDGNGVATYCIKTAGRGIEIWHSQFEKPAASSSGICIWVTNGTSTTGDRYVQQRIMFCRVESNGTGRGIEISDSLGGSSCTDGRIFDVQANGCNHGSVLINAGGWGINGGHVTQSAGGSGTYNFRIEAGFTHISNTYFDTPTGNFAPLIIANNNFTVHGCFFIVNGNPSCIDLGSSKGSVVACSFGGSPANTNFVNSTSSTWVAVGNSGPSTALSGSLFGGGGTPVGSASNNLY